MSRSAGARGTNRPIQVFVSYSPADERWATWVAWELEAAGYRTMLQAWDFVPGTNFIDFMDRGLSQASAVVAVLSRHYMRDPPRRPAYHYAFRQYGPAKTSTATRTTSSRPTWPPAREAASLTACARGRRAHGRGLVYSVKCI
jgi:hypothetical protein